MFKPLLLASALVLAMIGCESDRTTDTTTDARYRQSDDLDRRSTVGQDDYQRGVPDRTSTDHATEPGAVIQPNAAPLPPPAPPSDAPLSQSDRTFVEEAAGGGLFDVQSAQLAIERNIDPQMAQVARMLLEDHRRANQELESIASSKGIQIPQQLPRRYQTMLNQLRDRRGDDFTRSFHQIQKQAHEEAIALFQKQASSGQDPQLRAFAQRTLPVLQKHLQHVEQHSIPGGMHDEDVDVEDTPSTTFPPMSGGTP